MRGGRPTNQPAPHLGGSMQNLDGQPNIVNVVTLERFLRPQGGVDERRRVLAVVTSKSTATRVCDAAKTLRDSHDHNARRMARRLLELFAFTPAELASGPLIVSDWVEVDPAELMEII